MLTSNAQIQQQLLLQQQQQNWPQQQHQQQQQGPQQHHRPSIGPPQLSLGDGIQIVVDDVDHFAKQQHVSGKVILPRLRQACLLIVLIIIYKYVQTYTMQILLQWLLKYNKKTLYRQLFN